MGTPAAQTTKRLVGHDHALFGSVEVDVVGVDPSAVMERTTGFEPATSPWQAGQHLRGQELGDHVQHVAPRRDEAAQGCRRSVYAVRRRSKPDARLLALGGIVGPVAFVGTWVVAGAVTPGYSPIGNAISDLAAVGTPHRAAMTGGFVVFGIGLIAFGLALHKDLDGQAWVWAVATGGATIAVAATPLGGWSGDGVHAVCAGLGYVTIAALPLFAARALAASGRRPWARVSIAAAGLSAAALAASTLGPAHGLWQRLGLTVGDAWIATTAVGLAVGIGPARRQRVR